MQRTTITCVAAPLPAKESDYYYERCGPEHNCYEYKIKGQSYRRPMRDKTYRDKSLWISSSDLAAWLSSQIREAYPSYQIQYKNNQVIVEYDDDQSLLIEDLSRIHLLSHSTRTTSSRDDYLPHDRNGRGYQIP